MGKIQQWKRSNTALFQGWSSSAGDPEGVPAGKPEAILGEAPLERGYENAWAANAERDLVFIF